MGEITYEGQILIEILNDENYVGKWGKLASQSIIHVKFESYFKNFQFNKFTVTHCATPVDSHKSK